MVLPSQDSRRRSSSRRRAGNKPSAQREGTHQRVLPAEKVWCAAPLAAVKRLVPSFGVAQGTPPARVSAPLSRSVADFRAAGPPKRRLRPVQRSRIAAMIGTGARATSGVAEHSVDTLLYVTVGALPERSNAAEVTTEACGWVWNDIATAEAVAPRICRRAAYVGGLRRRLGRWRRRRRGPSG